MSQLVLPAGWDTLRAHGVEEWTWRVLNWDRRIVGELDNAGTGSIDLNVHDTVRGGGNVLWEGTRADEPDWVDVLLQPWFKLTAPDGSVVEWPLGVFIPSTPIRQLGEHGLLSLDVRFYDLTLRLQGQALDEPYVVARGDNLVEHARQLVESVLGPGSSAIESSDVTARTPMVFTPPMTVRQALGKVLDAAGYFAPYADNKGLIRSSPYRAPADRRAVWHFRDGDVADYAPGVERESDWFSIPNRVLAYSQPTGDDVTLQAIASNDDPDDKLSTVNRGYWDRIEENIQAADQAALQDVADRLLATSRDATAKVTLEHLPVPVGLNDRVTFEHDGDDPVSAVVQTISITTEPGQLWTTTAREVAA